MATNKITRFKLEPLAEELRARNKSYAEIAAELCKVSKQEISVSSVQRFFTSNEQAKIKAVEKSDKLQAKVAEAEINTLTEAMACVDKLKDICEAAMNDGDHRTAILAVKEIYTGLDIVNKVLGKYKTSPLVQVNNQQNNVVNIATVKEKMKNYATIWDEDK
jgi:hypothetical protein